MNWTAIIITALICWTLVAISKNGSNGEQGRGCKARETERERQKREGKENE